MRFGTLLLPALAAFLAVMSPPMTRTPSSPISAPPMESPATNQEYPVQRSGNIVTITGFKERPYGLHVQDDGTLFVMDAMRGRVVKFSADLARQEIFVNGTSEDFPHALAVDSKGAMLVPDHRKGTIRKFSADGTSLGLFYSSPASKDLAFTGPIHVHVDAKGALWVSDYRAHRIMKFSADGTLLGWKGAKTGGEIVQKFAMTGTSEESNAIGGFSRPHMVTTDNSGNFYVVDVGANRVQKFAPDGTSLGWIGANADGSVTKGWSKAGTSAAGEALGAFNSPTAIYLMPGSDMLIVTDNYNNRIQRFSAATGAFQGWIGGKSDGTAAMSWQMQGQAEEGKRLGAFSGPFQAEMLGKTLYVADTGNGRVQIITLTE